MTRQRKLPSVEKVNNIHNYERLKQSPGNTSINTPIKGFIALICVAVAFWFAYKGYLETRVNTPFDNNKIVRKCGLALPSRYWGSYRPGTYFGLKTREPYSPVMGLMWYIHSKIQPGALNIRHWCEQGDNLGSYTWTQHDGNSFGVQEIYDGPFKLTTSFVKRFVGDYGGDWTARVSIDAKSPDFNGETASLIFYTAIEDQTKGYIQPTVDLARQLTGILGETHELGRFRLNIFNTSGSVIDQSYLSTKVKGLDLLKEKILSSMRVITSGLTKRRVLRGSTNGNNVAPNFIATQVTVRVPFTMDVVYQSNFLQRSDILLGRSYDEELSVKSRDFKSKFSNIFKLHEKGYSEREITIAEKVFSNLIGGIGHFYGASQVKSDYTSEPVSYWKAPLYTSVPSRSFFPRGFLWDEGFHGMLLAAWDLDIEFDIMSHWFDLMNIEGWIPREQILGQEALAKVPEEFVTQRNTNANPPTFFLTLRFILNNFAESLIEGDRLDDLERIFPRLVAWFEWFNRTQVGDVAGTYRWRGRDAHTNSELNPKTLTSGLDDYPRASHPTSSERHVDLRCWIALAASVLSDIAKLLNRPMEKYLKTYLYLSDNVLLDKLHWSERTKRYSDYGLHTDSVTLKRLPPPPPGQPVDNNLRRVVLSDPYLQLVDSSFGYVSLFPFLLQILDPNSDKLGTLLTNLKNPQLLWTPFGLRSLSKDSPLYMKWNTKHDGPYWRAPIWINMNYMALQALHYYKRKEGPYAEQAETLYKELRSNVINNVIKEFDRTGYVWEQYNDKNGHGQGCRPFTGWSSLVVLIMAEIY